MEETNNSPEGRKSKLPESLAAELSSRLSSDEVIDDAIDDSTDADEELVQQQRQITQSRLEQHNSAERLLHKVIPFHWAPRLAPLIETDVETCITLENAAFAGAKHRSTGYQVEYRIRKCGGICFGFFNSFRPHDAEGWYIGTMRHCREVETGREDGAKHVMFAHIIATLGEHQVVTDNDMKCPEKWQEAAPSSGFVLGHQAHGRTICLHSLSVYPDVQGIGIGKTVLKSYIELMKDSGVADRIALICKQSTVAYFERFGFNNVGHSQTTVAGQGWEDMVIDISVGKRRNKRKECHLGSDSCEGLPSHSAGAK